VERPSGGAASFARTEKASAFTLDHLDAITTALNDSRGERKTGLHSHRRVPEFMNIYQTRASRTPRPSFFLLERGHRILAPVKLSPTPSNSSAAHSKQRRVENWEQSSKLWFQYIARFHDSQSTSRRWGSTHCGSIGAGPTRITYSEDRFEQHLPPRHPPDVTDAL